MHPLHHDQPGRNDGEARHEDHRVVQAIAEGVLARLRTLDLVTELTENLCLELGNVLRSHPDRPEVQPERRVDDVEEDGGREQESRHPMPLDPWEADSDDGQKRRGEQHEHRDRHDPVKEACRQ